MIVAIMYVALMIDEQAHLSRGILPISFDLYTRLSILVDV